MSTIADVARQAGVSMSTVSHVINGTRHVNPETAQKVRDAIAATGFRPNTVARSLKMASTDSVGIAVSAFSNPYFSDIISAIETECARLGLMVFLSDTKDDPEQELKVVQALHQRRVDGIILAPSGDADGLALNYLLEHRIPSVLVDRTPSTKFDQVGVHNKSAAQSMVRHLVEHGHKRIGYISGQPGFTTSAERIRGYKAALKAAGIDFDETLLITGSMNTEDAAQSASRLFDMAEPPTAIAAGNNMAMIGAMAAIGRRGLSVPGDVALVGFDDFEWADYFEPRLTVIAQPCQEIGRQAAALLVGRIADPTGTRETIRLKPQLIIRSSCGCNSPHVPRTTDGGFRLPALAPTPPHNPPETE